MDRKKEIISRCSVLSRIPSYEYRSRPSTFGSHTELGNRSRVSVFFDVPTWQPYGQTDGWISRNTIAFCLHMHAERDKVIDVVAAATSAAV